MKVLVSGSSGLVGRELMTHLKVRGTEVSRLVRGPASFLDEVTWDPASGRIDGQGLADLDAVVHLAGENIADGRWTESKMRRIRDSRVAGTRQVAEALARLAEPPRTLVCASAVGIYGDRGDEVLLETSRPGTGFLAEVCRDWEAACEPARAAGIRVVNLRIGVVLTPDGGALAKMLVPFRLGLGGRLGSGRQYMSWISLTDVVRAIHHVLSDDRLSGPIHAVAPRAVTNEEYTRELGRVLARPTVLPVPAPAARLAFGRMAQDLLLASLRVEPRVLLESGFEFAHPELEGALRDLLGRAA